MCFDSVYGEAHTCRRRKVVLALLSQVCEYLLRELLGSFSAGLRGSHLGDVIRILFQRL